MDKKNQLKIPDTNDKKYILIGLFVIFFMFGVLGVWAAYAPLATSSVAVGKIVPSSATVPIQHLTSGVIEKIYVKDGDIVKKDDTILKLRDIDLKEKLKSLTSQYQQFIATKNRLDAQVNNLENVEFSDMIEDSIKESQLKIFNETKNALKTKAELTKNQISQYQQEIKSSKSILQSKNSRLSSVLKELQEQKSLFKERLVGKQKLVQLQKESDGLRGDINSIKANILKQKDQIEQAKNNLKLFRKNLRQQNLEKLSEIKSKITNVNSQMVSIKDRLNRIAIKSPISGVVMGIDKHTAGEVVKPGGTICEIIPKGSKLIIEAKVSTKDIDKVKVGLKADLQFPSLDMRKLPYIKGKVIYVSADTRIDPRSKMSFYEAKIVITKEGLKILKEHNLPLIVGMPAVAMIRIGERTMLDYLIKPMREMVQRSFNEE